MTLSDLPNGGRNLRVYTYDPAGTPFYKPDGYLYNTGHYDLCLTGGPCSASDPQGFQDWATMAAYVQSRGEWGLVIVTRDDLNTLCAIPPKGVGTVYSKSCGGTATSTTPGAVAQGALSTGSTVYGGTSGTTMTPVAASDGIVYPPGSVPPPGTSIAAGGVPSSGIVGQVGFQGLNAVYRFILHDPSNPDGPWSTGANYPGCSKVNTSNCDPQAFQTESDAVAYAIAHNEIPYRVLTADEVWKIIDGTEPFDPKRVLKQGLSLPMLALLGVGAYLVFFRR